MRIIGGTFRGRKLTHVGAGDAAAHLRPTSDRVRESLFNVLNSGYADWLHGGRVLDLFAGTGALGLEALSRGAQEVCFVEKGRVSLTLLRENIALCKAEDQTRVLTCDALQPGTNTAAPYDLIFLDPPYGQGLGEQALDAALSEGWLTEDALIVWEEGGAIVIPSELTQLEERQYGDTVIRILQRDK